MTQKNKSNLTNEKKDFWRVSLKITKIFLCLHSKEQYIPDGLTLLSTLASTLKGLHFAFGIASVWSEHKIGIMTRTRSRERSKRPSGGDDTDTA